MERAPGTPKSSEAALVEKYGLIAGKEVAFKKIAMHSASEVPVGDVQEGILKDAVRVGSRITFSDNPGAISEVQKIEEQYGQLFIHTRTSTYVLSVEKASGEPENFSWDDIEEVETARGSTYRYLPDGTTRRFKKVEGREYEAQAALVYVPPFEWVKQRATPEMLKKIGEEDYVYEDNLLTYVQNPRKDGRKVYIVDATGKRIETNEEIKNAEGQVYLAFLKDGKTDFFIPVSHKPVVGFSTFDTRSYVDEETGEDMRERHLGNQVVRITLKDKPADTN
jgi:hypothetical protein